MKKVLLPILTLFTFLGMQAQEAATVVFTENGELFTLYLNGVKQNEAPQSSIELNDLKMEFYQSRIDFEDPAFADFSNKNFAVKKGMVVSYMIKRNRKGEFVLRYQSETAMTDEQAAPALSTPPRPAPPTSPTPVMERTETVQETVIETETGVENVNISMDMPGVSTTTTSTTTTVKSPNGEKVKIDLKVPGVDVKFDVDMDMGMGVEIREESSVTTTTTSQTSSGGVQPRMTTGVWVDEEVEEIPDCSVASSDFSKMKAAVDAKTFADSKMTTAKQATKNKCLTCDQIKALMLLFTFEDDKLEFAQYAYDNCADRDNYYLVYDAFEFESSIDELNEYIEMR